MSDPVDYLSDKLETVEGHSHHPWRTVVIIFVILVLTYAAAVGGLMAYGVAYKDKVLPGVFVGNLSVGGMGKDELTHLFQSMSDRLLAEGIHIIVQKADATTDSFAFYPVVPAGEDSQVLITMDTEKEAKALISYGKKETMLRTGMAALVTRLRPVHHNLNTVTADTKRLVAALRERVAQDETPPREAQIQITSANPLRYTITTSSPGVIFPYENGIADAIETWKKLELPTITFSPEFTNTQMHEQDIAERVEDLPVLLADGLVFTYNLPDSGYELKWPVTANQLAGWIVARTSADGKVQFDLSEEKVFLFLEEKVAPTVNVQAQDAKFRMGTDGKVVEFQGSRTGFGIAVSSTYAAAEEAVLARLQTAETNKKISLVMEETLPAITTADVNSLGITGILGVGTSSFTGSPKNRLINIRNAINKLNGVIVKPGEEFSTIAYTKPFTLEGGYVPEKVIKGDEIKPEIGGGLCQVGSTLFRMAMNSGMPITERRNHSLVVGYYNDPRDNLPGTDATIYDPAPDFKFLNDTGNNVLIQTDMNTKTAELRFTLWGTSDGRKGSYSPPVVQRWIPYGESKTIETTKLPPGEKECQHAYRGADASFTYYRVLPDGTKEDRVFESHYRPLPEICLVGVEPKCETPDAEGKCPEVPVDQTTQVPVAVE